MGFLINHNKIKRNRLRHSKSANHRSNRNMMCKVHYITEVLPSGAWKDKTCFLLGGGPSLKDFDFDLIRNELTIGVNKSFTRFPTTVNYAMDVRFYDMITCTGNVHTKNTDCKELYQQWLAYEGIKLFIKRSAKSKFDSSVYIVNNLGKKVLSLDLQKGIWGGNNSGFGALMLACALGATRIGLLGYDLKVQKKQKGIETHWHGGYGLGRAESFQSKLDKFKMCFEEFARAITKQGILVVNLNPNSALDCFPFDTIENFLR